MHTTANNSIYSRGTGQWSCSTEKSMGTEIRRRTWLLRRWWLWACNTEVHDLVCKRRSDLTLMWKDYWWHIWTKIRVFWDIMLRSLVIIYRHFGEDGCLHLLCDPKSLKTTMHHIPEDCNFHQQCCGNLKSSRQRPSQIKSHLHNQEMPLVSKLWQILTMVCTRRWWKLYCLLT